MNNVILVCKKRLQEAANFIADWPPHPLNANNTKIYQSKKIRNDQELIQIRFARV